MDWDRFTYDYRLESTGELLSPLITIEAYKEAALNLVLPPDWRTQLDKLNRVRVVHGTTALEGNPLSEAEVSRQMDILDETGSVAPSNNLTKEQIQISRRCMSPERPGFGPVSQASPTPWLTNGEI